MPQPNLYLGAWAPISSNEAPLTEVGGKAELPANHFTTHAVIFGMTGSGKTGLLTVTVEEALRVGIPTLMIDVKGDLPNLLLSFPRFEPSDLIPWIEPAATSEDKPIEQVAAEWNEQRRASLGAWSIGQPEFEAFVNGRELRVITPGSSSGELLHVLSSLERRSDRWDTDPEAARDALSAAVSLVLRLLGRDPDPAKSREHVLLSVLAEQRLRRGESAELGALLQDLSRPPIEKIGALSIDAFLPKNERKSLAAALNTLLASPTFASWREGASLEIGEWLKPRNGKTQAVIVSVAHLDDEERALVLGVLLEELLNPPTKRPLVALMKQARAFGVGVIVATHVHAPVPTVLVQPRWAMSLLRGPMTRNEIRQALQHPVVGSRVPQAKAPAE